MKAIITGATGGLGRNLVEFLVSKEWEILAFGRDEKIGKSLGVEFYSFDLSDFGQAERYFQKADVVFHCAALSTPWGEYEEFYKSNVKSTENVLKAMKLFNINRIVHVSTPSIYFNFKDQFDIKEDFVPNKFVNNYAKTKYEAEKIVLNDNFHSIIIRPRAIFGEYDNVLVPRLERVALKGFLPLIKNKKTIVDVTYVGNVVNALYLASIKDIPSKSIFNITNDESMDIKDILSLLMESLKIEFKFKYVSYFTLMLIATILETISKLGFIKEPLLTKYGVGVISKGQTLDISKAKEILGYKPIYSIKEGLQRYAKYRNL